MPNKKRKFIIPVSVTTFKSLNHKTRKYLCLRSPAFLCGTFGTQDVPEVRLLLIKVDEGVLNRCFNGRQGLVGGGRLFLGPQWRSHELMGQGTFEFSLWL